MGGSISTKQVTWILLAILLLAAVLRFWNLTGPDMLGDDAHYAMRAAGYFDYIGSTNTQTTPVVWFAEPQWWQRLSFHDAPPLVFAVEWLFFKLFGVNLFAARLPFVLAGLFAVWGMFLLARAATGNPWVGLVGAGALAVMNLPIWLSRIGLLDGFVLLWIIFSLYFFLRAREHPKQYLLWGLMCGLGMLTKYTFLFMGPLFLLLLLTTRRSAWKQKWFWMGFALFFVVLSPVIIYNVMVWKTRGHFDAAISTMVGMHPDDFRGLTRSVTRNFGSISNVLITLASTMSIGFSALILLGAAVAGITLLEERRRELLLLLGGGMFFSWAMLAFAGGSAHYNVVMLPFLVLALGIAAVEVVKRIKKREVRIALAAVGALALFWEMLFSVQSQLIPAPFITHPLLAASQRAPWLGYNALEEYVAGFYRAYSDPSYIVFAHTPQIRNYEIRAVQKYYAHGTPPLQQEHLLVYDDRMDWTGTAWIFERRRIYNVAAIPSLSNLLQAVEEKYLNKLVEFGFKDATVIIASDAIPHNTIVENDRLNHFAQSIMARYQPIAAIKNVLGETVFTVYELPLDDRLSLLL